jgi:hypothetical protein
MRTQNEEQKMGEARGTYRGEDKYTRAVGRETYLVDLSVNGKTRNWLVQAEGCSEHGNELSASAKCKNTLD